MTVKLVSYSQPTEEFASQGIADAQDLIAFCARVSNPSNQFNTETSDKLIRYLIKHKHFSPLEMVSACIEVETTRDIARQLLRHRSFSFQEFSQRYANPTQDLDFVTREARFQDSKNRQNSIELDVDSEEHQKIAKVWNEQQEMIIGICQNTYNWAIENGIAKEQARAVLPEGLIKSKLYVNGTIRSWIHFIEVRTEESTQKEHRELAFECAKAISKIFPMAEEFIYYPLVIEEAILVERRSLLKRLFKLK